MLGSGAFAHGWFLSTFMKDAFLSWLYIPGDRLPLTRATNTKQEGSIYILRESQDKF